MSHLELSPTIGLLQAIVEAIGESDAEIGGLFSTRLTAAVMAGATSLPVECTLGWQASGRISLNGQPYTYSSLTATTLDGIEHDANGVPTPGVVQIHEADAEVVDLTRARSALDSVRRALFVEYAETEDLNTLGRNLNVLRSPYLSDDDRFRKIVKALAYNPRGTMYGLELALGGLVDPGNFEIFEDLQNFPCTVFVRLTGAATTDDISIGKVFANNGQARPALSSTSVLLTATPLTVQNVLWKDEGYVTDARSAKPSVATLAEYTGQTPAPVWVFQGASEAVDVVVTAPQYTELQDNAVGAVTLYNRLARLQPESQADLDVLVALPSTGTYSAAAADVLQWTVAIHDTLRSLAIGVLNINASTYSLGFTAGTGLLGAPVVLNKNQFYSIGIHKRGQDLVELTVNGTIVDRLAHTSFAVSASHQFTFGCGSTTSTGARGRVKDVVFAARTLTDYWNSRGVVGAVNAGNPDELDVNLPGHFVTTDVGKQLQIRNAVTLNPQGGKNNGVWRIGAVTGAETVDLTGVVRTDEAAVSGVFTTRVTVGLAGAFQFPDDLGKKIVLTGSGLGNNGTFVIDKLLDPDALTDLQAALTQNPSKTNVCEVVGGAFVTESGLDWQLLPDFVTEVGLSWEMAQAGSNVGPLLTLRQPLPITTPAYERILNIVYTDVLSGQIIKDGSVNNSLLSEGPPPIYDYYPFYVSDPLGFVRSYLDEITAAGVIPEFLIV